MAIVPAQATNAIPVNDAANPAVPDPRTAEDILFDDFPGQPAYWINQVRNDDDGYWYTQVCTSRNPRSMLADHQTVFNPENPPHVQLKCAGRWCKRDLEAYKYPSFDYVRIHAGEHERALCTEPRGGCHKRWINLQHEITRRSLQNMRIAYDRQHTALNNTATQLGLLEFVSQRQQDEMAQLRSELAESEAQVINLAQTYPHPNAPMAIMDEDTGHESEVANAKRHKRD